jgi:hypothetical protein
MGTDNVNNVSPIATRATSRELRYLARLRARSAEQNQEVNTMDAVHSKKYEVIIEFIFASQIFLAGTFVIAMWYA